MGCPRRDVLPARTRALEEIRRRVEMQERQRSSISTQHPGSHDQPGSVLESMAVLPLLTLS
jgi:hypothetical protein